jgi:phosphoribosylamine--glycine ligase
MRFNIISETGDGAYLGPRLLEEGHDVRLWIRSHDCKEVMEGIVDKVGTIDELTLGASKDEDIFIFDGTGNGIIADSLRGQGFQVIGDSVLADRLEEDREFGFEVMKQAGIDTPETEEFHSFEDAISYVESKEDGFVYKPSSRLGLESMSHVCHDKDETLEYLKEQRAEVRLEDISFSLQQFTKGVAISTEIWFDGQDTIEGLSNHTLERKELMNENLGPSGGCSGNTIWRCGECPLCERVRGVLPFLREHGYRGMLDLNAIVNEDGIFGLEWTPRFGYDAAPTMLLKLVDGEIGFFLQDMSRGTFEANHWELKEGFASSLRVSIPPYPTEKYHADSGTTIGGLSAQAQKDCALFNVRRSAEGKLESAGAWGIILVITGWGNSIPNSYEVPYRIAERLKLPDKQYRTDLVEQFEKDFRKVERMLERIEVA